VVTETTETTTAAETRTESETKTETPGSAIELQVSDATVKTVETSVSEEIIGEAKVTNIGSAQTESFILGLDWLDSSGEYIATTDVYGLFLAAGETWIPRHPAWLDAENPENVDGVEASITETDPWGDLAPNPDGVELVEQSVRVGSDEIVVRGQVKNNQKTKEYIEAAGKVMDADGNVLAMADTIEEVASGDTWRFEMNPQTYGRNDQVDSGTVIPYI
jgi:hypothetical protein